MKPIDCKVLVLGAGPGGYVTAIRAGQLGLDTVIVEATKPGGTCLNVGCIPSKALIHVADEFEKTRRFAGDSEIGISVVTPTLDLAQTVAWKDGIVTGLNAGVRALLKKAGARLVVGWGTMIDGKTCRVKTDDGEVRIRAQNVVIATGSESVELPNMPFGGNVISSTEALSLSQVPPRLTVVGGGYIGLELGIAYAKMGSTVSVVEAAERVLPQYDSELTKPILDKLQALKIEVLLGAKAKCLSASRDAAIVELTGNREKNIPSDKILVTVGRRARTHGWGLSELDLTTDGRFIGIDEQCRTSMSGVYAVGDVTGEPMLAHRAIAQGEMVAEIIAGKRRAFDAACIPAVCFTDPEIVTVGLSPDEARAAGLDCKVGSFPLAANGRAITMESKVGFVRIVARIDNDVILGIQAVGKGVSELSASFSLAMEMGARLQDIAGTIHAHPTQSEGFPEAALSALGHALHI